MGKKGVRRFVTADGEVVRRRVGQQGNMKPISVKLKRKREDSSSSGDDESDDQALKKETRIERKNKKMRGSKTPVKEKQKLILQLLGQMRFITITK